MNTLNISLDVLVPSDIYNFCLLNDLDLCNYLRLLYSLNSVDHIVTNHKVFLEFFNQNPSLYQNFINERE